MTKTRTNDDPPGTRRLNRRPESSEECCSSSDFNTLPHPDPSSAKQIAVELGKLVANQLAADSSNLGHLENK